MKKFKNYFWRISNAIKIGWWAFVNPHTIRANNFKLLSDLLALILKVARESKPYMSSIAFVYPSEPKEEIVSIWAGAGIESDLTKRISELLLENTTLKQQLFELHAKKEIKT